MSDHANILSYLNECKRLYKAKDYLGAAISAYWCLQYCRNGKPYGMSGEMLNHADAEASQIFRSCSKKLQRASLSKTTFIYGTICHKLLWLHKNKYNLRHISPSTQSKFDRGHIIGNLAQRLFPNGVDASDVDSDKIIDMSRITLPFNLKQQLWIDNTKRYLNHDAIFEAAFVYDDVFAAIDILKNDPKGYIAYEVKSSKAITETFIKDCALQYYVINKNIKLEDFYLIYLNEEYLNEIQIPIEQISESNVDINKLFIMESVLSRILPSQSYISEQISKCKSILKKGEPEVSMGEQCTAPYECMYTIYCTQQSGDDFNVW